MNHFEYNTSKIIHMSYVNDSFLQVVKEYKFDHQINFDYSSTRKIKNKLYSIAIFV